MPSFKLKSSWVTILQGVEFSIFVLILAWALQQCSATALPVISRHETTSACFGLLRQLRGICRSAFQSLVSYLVLPRLDYCNAVLAGTPLHFARRLQSVMNAAARLVFTSSKSDHTTPLLHQLHWLKVPWRIDYKLASWPFWFTCTNVFMVWHRHTSLTNFIIQQSLSFEGVCVPLRLTCLLPHPTLNLQRPSFSSCRCTDLEQSFAAYRICSVTFRLLLSLEDILLGTLLPVITVVVPAKRHCHFYGYVNRSYLLTSSTLIRSTVRIHDVSKPDPLRLI